MESYHNFFSKLFQDVPVEENTISYWFYNFLPMGTLPDYVASLFLTIYTGTQVYNVELYFKFWNHVHFWHMNFLELFLNFWRSFNQFTPPTILFCNIYKAHFIVLEPLFHRDSLSLPVYVISMLQRIYLQRKYTGDYKSTKLKEKI